VIINSQRGEFGDINGIRKLNPKWVYDLGMNEEISTID
jgi:hypothetical protein